MAALPQRRRACASTSAPATSSRRLPSPRSATSCARNISSSLPRMLRLGRAAAATRAARSAGRTCAAEHGAPPSSTLTRRRSRRRRRRCRSPRISWTRTLAERLAVERDLACAVPRPSSGRPRWNTMSSAEAERREVERRAVVAGDQRDAAIEPAGDPQRQGRAVGARSRSRTRRRAPNRPVPASGTLADERQPAERGAVARVEIAQLERRRRCARSRRAGATRRRRAAARSHSAIAAEHDLRRRARDDQRLAAAPQLDAAAR